MLRRTCAFASIALVLSMLAATDVSATAQRTFVSGAGADANPCTLTMPCRSFATAITQTTAGGEIIVLDSAGYGGLSINKPISIIAPTGIYAGVTVFSGVGITVNTPGASDVVVLRGLTLNGLGGTTGIQVDKVGALHVSNVEIANFTFRGMFFAAEGQLFVSESVVRESGESGIHVAAATGFALVAVSRSRFERNSYNGIAFAGSTRGTISESTADGNAGVGFLVDQSSDATISDCSVSGGAYGILVRGAGARARITRCSARPASEFLPTSQGYTSTGGAGVVIVDSVGYGGYGAFVVETSSSMTLERCTATSAYGAMVVTGSGGGVLSLSNSTVAYSVNGFGIVPGAGTVETRQNNTVRQTSTPVNGSVVSFGPL